MQYHHSTENSAFDLQARVAEFAVAPPPAGYLL
jgi:hypothetical protein